MTYEQQNFKYGEIHKLKKPEVIGLCHDLADEFETNRAEFAWKLDRYVDESTEEYRFLPQLGSMMNQGFFFMKLMNEAKDLEVDFGLYAGRFFIKVNDPFDIVSDGWHYSHECLELLLLEAIREVRRMK